MAKNAHPPTSPAVSLPAPRQRLEALTSLRIFAAMHVVLFHVALQLLYGSANRWVARTQHAAMPIRVAVRGVAMGAANIVAAGPWSVSLFFVLSGFILTYNYSADDEPLDVRRFWIARIARIYPPYIFAMVMAAPFALHASFIAHSLSASSLAIGGILCATLLQAWSPTYALAWNPPAWSVSDEIFFYALFPALVWLLARRTRPIVPLLVLLGCWAASMIQSLIFWPTPEGAAWASSRFIDIAYSPICRLPEFIAGVALARLVIHRGQITPSKSSTPLALAALGAIIVMAALGESCPRIFAGPGGLTPLFALLIWALADHRSFVARLLAWSPLVFFGEASYTIYILHVPLARWFGAVVHRLSPALPEDPRQFNVPNYPLMFAYVAALLVVSAVVYKWFEAPMRNRVRKALGRYFDIRPLPRAVPAAVLTAEFPDPTRP